MKLTDEMLNDFIKEFVGSDAVSLVQYTKNKEDVSEFKIAEELKLNINLIRNMLYRLSAHNLVDSIRKKDKKKGWYIYYWTFNTQRAAELIIKNKERKLDGLKHLLHRISTESFFVCPTDGLTLSFESAMEHNFKCPEDGELLKQKDSSMEIEKLGREIETLQIEVASGIEIEKKKERKSRIAIAGAKRKLFGKKLKKGKSFLEKSPQTRKSLQKEHWKEIKGKDKQAKMSKIKAKMIRKKLRFLKRKRR